MKLTIQRKLGDERDDELIRDAVLFMLQRLLTPAQIERVSLHILVTRLHGDFGDIELTRAPSFHIRLHYEVNAILLMVTLAHELVHMAQVMNGRLELKKIKDLSVWYWDGIPYGTAPYDDPELVLPWETDAEECECDLVRHFVDFYVTSLNPS